MLTNDDKRWITEIMDDRSSEQDQGKGLSFNNMEVELSEQAKEYLHHIDATVEKICNKIASCVEDLPDANSDKL